MNPYFRDSLVLSIRGAVAEANATAQLDHRYLRGKIREIAIRGLIAPWFTNTYSTGTGKVTDCNGRLSNEVDILIYATDVHPPLFYSQDGFGLYPCEACLATIEVKSTLNATELRSALDSSAKLSSNYLEFQSGRLNETATATIPNPFLEIGRCLFAFSTDLSESGKTELTRYQQYSSPEEGKRLDMICVVGRGCWVAQRIQNGENKWIYFEPTGNYDEVVAFCSILSSSLATIHRDRGRPPLNTYIGLPDEKPA